ncbi:MAG: GNAT family N-acetyltransferase [Ruminococcus sp.]|jgi:GNAT superfamily N-acetyltransferase|nr:GNAT family N-acetyltransferase [Ruminococcus sp.]
MNITYRNTITVEDYNTLRKSAGWKPIHAEQAAAGLTGSALIVAAADGMKTIGTARLVWDGGYAALIKDVLVLPEYQGQGIGTEMMNCIMNFLREKLKPGYSIQIDMMAAFSKEGFYEKFSFTSRPRENRGAGMDMWLKGD